MNSTPTTRKGAIVTTKSGKKGYVYWDEMEDSTQKTKVRLIDKQFQETGENLLCDRDSLKIIGFKD